MIEIELKVKCDECGAELDASVHGDIIYVSPCECQKDKIAQLESELEELENDLAETIELFEERSRECVELKAHNEVLQKRVQEFSMELLD